MLSLPERDYVQSLEKLGKTPLAANKRSNKELNDLLSFGGFPEPLLSGSSGFAGRWRLAYGERLVNEEVRSLEQTQELDRLPVAFTALTILVSSIR